jgi:tetratricopeptide (TPR) repeat protein
VAIDLNNIGSAWDDLGDTKKAIEYYEQAYQIALVVWEKDHPSTLSILESLKTAKRNS